MGFHSSHWPTTDQVRETVGALTQSGCPAPEADIIGFLAARGIRTAVESRTAEGQLIGYDFDAPKMVLNGQWYMDGSRAVTVIATFGASRTEVESRLELYKRDLIHLLGEPLQEEGMARAPRLAWHRPKHTITLDAYWSVPDLAVLMLGVELRHAQPPGR